jgi:hypothetical protein
MANRPSSDQIQAKIENESFASNDLLVILWLAFVDNVEDLLAGQWGKGYQAATVRSRFIRRHATRAQLYKAVDETDLFMKKRTLKKLWAIGAKDGEGFFEFLHRCILG